jgi:two-component system, NtrC family, nitrogen regulation response regulator NtrX
MAYNILCLDDDNKFLTNLKSYLNAHYNVMAVDKFDWAMTMLENTEIDLVLLDLEMQGVNGIEALKIIKTKYPAIEVVMLSGHKDAKNIVEAIKHGASDYLTKDTFPEELIAYIDKTLSNKDFRDKYNALLQDINSNQVTKTRFANPKSFESLLIQTRRLKGRYAHVLIQGESGTGKEVLARYIHDIEEQLKRPFIAVNCAAIPDQIIESELFGHEKGAFTGAIGRKIGKFELADNGDVLLDEINSLKPDLQAKILRALETQEFYRVGSIKPIRVNFRVISTSNVDLEEQIQKGNFREDLYHRLNVVLFKIPPLRERIDEIHDLIDYFIEEYSQKYGLVRKKIFSNEALSVFMEYYWPGNIRELKNIIQSILIMCTGDVIDVNDLPEKMLKKAKTVKDKKVNMKEDYYSDLINSPSVSLLSFRKKMEEKYIQRIIRENKGNKSAAAKVLEISRFKLYDILKNQGGEGYLKQ